MKRGWHYLTGIIAEVKHDDRETLDFGGWIQDNVFMKKKMKRRVIMSWGIIVITLVIVVWVVCELVQ